jgi:hypothetical protein
LRRVSVVVSLSHLLHTPDKTGERPLPTPESASVLHSLIRTFIWCPSIDLVDPVDLVDPAAAIAPVAPLRRLTERQASSYNERCRIGMEYAPPLGTADRLSVAANPFHVEVGIEGEGEVEGSHHHQQSHDDRRRPLLVDRHREMNP